MPYSGDHLFFFLKRLLLLTFVLFAVKKFDKLIHKGVFLPVVPNAYPIEKIEHLPCPPTINCYNLRAKSLKLKGEW